MHESNQSEDNQETLNPNPNPNPNKPCGSVYIPLLRQISEDPCYQDIVRSDMSLRFCPVKWSLWVFFSYSHLRIVVQSRNKDGQMLSFCR